MTGIRGKARVLFALALILGGDAGATAAAATSGPMLLDVTVTDHDGNLVDGLQVLAYQSGGRVLNSSNDVAGEIARCAVDAGTYYVLSIQPPPGNQTPHGSSRK